MWQATRFTLKICKHSANKLFLTSTFLQILQATFLIFDTYFLKLMIDAISSQSFLGFSLINLLVFRLIFQIAKTVIERLTNIVWAVFKNEQIIYLNKIYVDKIAQLDLAQFENSETVGLINRALPRIQWQFSHYVGYILNVIYALVELIIPFVIFLTISPLAALFLIFSNVLVLLINTKMNKAYFNIFKASDEERRRFGYAIDLITDRKNLAEIKLFQAFDFIKKRIVDIHRSFSRKEILNDRKYQILMMFAEVLPIVAAFIFLWLTAQKVQSQTITIGSFVFIFTNILVFTNALGTLRRHLAMMNADSRFIADIEEFFQLKPYINFIKLKGKNSNLKQELIQKINKPNILIDNVSFTYPNSKIPAIRNLTLQIPYGKNVAIVGENGAGKTTLIKLLMRIYEPSNGKISINGINLSLIPEDVLYASYSTLFQDFGKFYLTFKENLELGAKQSLDKPTLEKYTKLSNAWEFIKLYPDKFKQILGPEYKNGVDLSGGQWQRLGIARALAKNAPILILDEPTSAIDPKAEAMIFDRLTKYANKKTMLFISHRFSTIKDAETIVVMHKGSILEQGTHSQLMAKNQCYAKLYNLQASRYLRQ
jgi:ATP-binding cassette, subfamily B, bacterial